MARYQLHRLQTAVNFLSICTDFLQRNVLKNVCKLWQIYSGIVVLTNILLIENAEEMGMIACCFWQMQAVDLIEIVYVSVSIASVYIQRVGFEFSKFKFDFCEYW